VRRWVAIGAVAIAALLGVALLELGRGGGDSGSERAVEWKVERVIGPRAVRLVAVVGVCFEPVRLEQPITEYSGDRAYIELRHTPEVDHGGCFLSLMILHKNVTVNRPLDELELFDASTDPPERRWPRRR
jgi:hypothetical protein